MSEPGNLSRRQLLGASGAAGAAAVVAGCGLIPPVHSPVSKITLRVSRSDVPILDGLLQTEYRSAYAYTASVPRLSHYGLRLARWFLHHELAHITVLDSLIRTARVKPAPPLGSYPIGHARDQREVLAVLHGIEAASLEIYGRAIPRLSQGRLRAIAASIMANRAQHSSLLRAALGLQPVPAALVMGSE